MSDTKRHPHYDAIIAWAEGKHIQGRPAVSLVWRDLRRPAFSSEWEYRVKPETVKYKRFLWRSAFNPKSRPTVVVVHFEEQAAEPREEWQGFIRWIDKEWQEVEV